MPLAASYPTTEKPTIDQAPSDGPVLRGTDGKDTFFVTIEGTTVQGGGNWDVVTSSVDFVMSDDVEKLELTGTGNIDAEGSGSNDLILGNDADNVIRGNGGDDRIWGRDGDDTILGGDAADELNGGTGDDTFRFDQVTDSLLAAPDVLSGFVSGTDLIDLSMIDADDNLAGNQAFVWNGDGTTGFGRLVAISWAIPTVTVPPT